MCPFGKFCLKDKKDVGALVFSKMGSVFVGKAPVQVRTAAWSTSSPAGALLVEDGYCHHGVLRSLGSDTRATISTEGAVRTHVARCGQMQGVLVEEMADK